MRAHDFFGRRDIMMKLIAALIWHDVYAGLGGL
jgi:hypothetical protein